MLYVSYSWPILLVQSLPATGTLHISYFLPGASWEGLGTALSLPHVWPRTVEVFNHEQPSPMGGERLETMDKCFSISSLGEHILYTHKKDSREVKSQSSIAVVSLTKYLFIDYSSFLFCSPHTPTPALWNHFLNKCPAQRETNLRQENISLRSVLCASKTKAQSVKMTNVNHQNLKVTFIVSFRRWLAFLSFQH